jgi:hypothetical protein
VTRGRERIDERFERPTGGVGGALRSRSAAAAPPVADRERRAPEREHGDRPPSSDDRRAARNACTPRPTASLSGAGTCSRINRWIEAMTSAPIRLPATGSAGGTPNVGS